MSSKAEKHANSTKSVRAGFLDIGPGAKSARMRGPGSTAAPSSFLAETARLVAKLYDIACDLTAQSESA